MGHELKYDWKTPMRSGEDPVARERDGLIGQAAAAVLGDHRVQLFVMSDSGVFPSIATISAGDAHRLADMITRRVPNP